jgi:transcriptional regulator of acetoin/glycerol metabolism
MNVGERLAAIADPEHARLLRAARDRFLAGGPLDPGLHPSIARSWLRSRQVGVDPDHLIVPFDEAFCSDTALKRAAVPIVDRLFESFSGCRVCCMLMDSNGRLVARWVAHPDLLAALDRICGQPGAVYAEEFVGTTALGTALEDGELTVVSGPEHFSVELSDIVAVGAPVRHPITHRLEGIVDLVMPSRDAGPAALPLIERVAAEIGQQLLAGAARHDRLLLDEFTLLDRRGSRRPIFAITDRSVIANVEACDALGTIHHPSVWAQIERLLDGSRCDVDLIFTDGVQRRVRVNPVRDDGQVLGAVVQVPTGRPEGDRGVVALPTSPRAVTGSAKVMRSALDEGSALAELTGRSLVWQHVLGQVDLFRRTGGRLLLAGEFGTGKRSVAAAFGRDLNGAVSWYDAAECTTGSPRDWLESLAADHAGRGVIVGRLHHVPDQFMDILCDRLEATEATHIVGTFDTGLRFPLPPRLMAVFGEVISVPPLRQRKEDIADIASSFLGSTHRLSAEALRVLVGRDWPGNVSELRTVLTTAQNRAAGVHLRPTDFPPDLIASASPALTPLHKLEAEAIRLALEAARGDKRVAGQELGISRATLYRKLKALNIRP